MQRLLIVGFLVMLSGCHTGAPRVDCDRELQPINTPVPLVKEPAATSAATP